MVANIAKAKRTCAQVQAHVKLIQGSLMHEDVYGCREISRDTALPCLSRGCTKKGRMILAASVTVAKSRLANVPMRTASRSKACCGSGAVGEFPVMIGPASID